MKQFCRYNLLIEIYCDLNLIADGRKLYTLKHTHTNIQLAYRRKIE